jgi:hypothetical protein
MNSSFDFMNWWSHLDWSLHAFLILGILSLVALAFQAILSLMVGHDGDIGHDVAGGHDTGSAVFSIKGITAAFFGFSWTGVIVLINGGPVWAATLAGIVVGLAFCFGYLAAMRALLHLQSDGTFKIESTIGLVATVYTAIPPKGVGNGVVTIKTPTRLAQLKAYNTGVTALVCGQDVKITALHGAGVAVEPLQHPL